MSADLAIRVDEIRTALARVLDAIEAKHGSTLVLTKDYYWSLPVRAAFDMTRTDPELTIGQVTDDIAEIRALEAETGVLSPWHELAHLVGVLRAVEALDLP